MSTEVRSPARRPCLTCPYRIDVPAGIWHPDEYDKLRPYDGETFEQPPKLFLCHQRDGRLCAGWVACHDMGHNLAVRVAVSHKTIGEDDVEKILDYTTDVPVFDSGQDATDHGMSGVDRPSPDAVTAMRRLETKRARRATRSSR